MKRELPKTVPSNVIRAAGAVYDKADEYQRNRVKARRDYTSVEYRQQARWAYDPQKIDDPIDLAQALVDWAVMVRDSLPAEELCRRFRTDADFGPCVPLVSHEISLAPCEGFSGGKLVTKLDLLLDADEGLFRHDDWFNGFRVTGGGLLNSANAVQMSLHPEMLRQVFAVVAEGQTWRRIEQGLADLAEDFKDR